METDKEEDGVYDEGKGEVGVTSVVDVATVVVTVL